MRSARLIVDEQDVHAAARRIADIASGAEVSAATADVCVDLAGACGDQGLTAELGDFLVDWAREVRRLAVDTRELATSTHAAALTYAVTETDIALAATPAPAPGPTPHPAP